MVAEHRALGKSRRAGGVADRRQIFGSVARRFDGVGAPTYQIFERNRVIERRAAEHHDLLQAAVLLEMYGSLGALRRRDQNLGTAILDDIGQLVRGQHGIDRIDDGAGLGNADVA